MSRSLVIPWALRWRAGKLRAGALALGRHLIAPMVMPRTRYFRAIKAKAITGNKAIAAVADITSHMMPCCE